MSFSSATTFKTASITSATSSLFGYCPVAFLRKELRLSIVSNFSLFNSIFLLSTFYPLIILAIFPNRCMCIGVTHISNPKKLIFLAIFAVLTFPSVAPAQTFSVEQENQIKAIIQQITDLQIQLLLAKIAELKAQIAELLTQQTIMTRKVDTIAEGTVTPIVTPPTPPKVIPAVPVITVGEPYCEGDNVLLPVSIEGKWKE